MYILRKYQNIISFIPIFFILSGYLIFNVTYYNSIPILEDGIYYCARSIAMEQNISFIDRFVHYYLGRLLTFPFNHSLEAFASVSTIYHIIIIILAYLIVSRLSGKIQGLIAACFVSLLPPFRLYTTQYFTDTTCLLFGLTSFYFSLDINKKKYSIFLSGFFLCASILSKIFGLTFIIPVIINLWNTRTWKFCIHFILGGILLLLILAVLDAIFLKNFFFHINPYNYIEYLQKTSSLLEEYKNIPGKEGTTLISYFRHKQPYFFVYIFFCFSLFFILKLIILRVIILRKKLNWQQVGKITILLSSAILAGLFIKNNITYKSWVVQDIYLYCIIVPPVLSFGSFISFPSTEKISNNNYFFISIIFAIIYIIILFSMRYFCHTVTLNYKSNLSHLIFILSTGLLLISSYILNKYSFKKISIFIFIFSFIVILLHFIYWGEYISWSKFKRSRQISIECKNSIDIVKSYSKSGYIVAINAKKYARRNLSTYLWITTLNDKEFGNKININYYGLNDSSILKEYQSHDFFYLLTGNDAKFLKTIEKEYNMEKALVEKKIQKKLFIYKMIPKRN